MPVLETRVPSSERFFRKWCSSAPRAPHRFASASVRSPPLGPRCSTVLLGAPARKTNTTRAHATTPRHRHAISRCMAPGRTPHRPHVAPCHNSRRRGIIVVAHAQPGQRATHLNFQSHSARSNRNTRHNAHHTVPCGAAKAFFADQSAVCPARAVGRRKKAHRPQCQRLCRGQTLRWAAQHACCAGAQRCLGGVREGAYREARRHESPRAPGGMHGAPPATRQTPHRRAILVRAQRWRKHARCTALTTFLGCGMASTCMGGGYM